MGVGGQGLVLVIFMVTSYYNDVQGASCNVTGVWVNTLGSVLKLSAEGSQLKGSLHSSVELYPGAAGDLMTGKLIGLIGHGDQPTFTMSITWKEGSVTAWVGQCFQMSDCPVLKTMWLLRSKATVEDDWKATRRCWELIAIRLQTLQKPQY
ncbi:avidin-related protein 4/5-like [Phyllobates terribilis]|uniref:avidin-related protein 4/5-like n=1 Tax=Phyllobates terribilis TaxID=111132 RepID=UPI003CCB1080